MKELTLFIEKLVEHFEFAQKPTWGKRELITELWRFTATYSAAREEAQNAKNSES